MATLQRSFDWRVPAIWAVLLGVSIFAHGYVELANEARRGNAVGLGRVLMVEVASHLVVAALLPALYWLHRRWPIAAQPRNVAIHVLGIVPFSLIHTAVMAALRLLWFAGILGEAYAFPLTWERLLYEGAKDVVNYGMLSAAILALRHLLDRLPAARRHLPPARGPNASQSESAARRSWSRWRTSTGSRPPATTPSSMSAVRRSRSARP